jgi:hypothetical protein
VKAWSCLEVVKDPFTAYVSSNSTNKFIFPFVDPWIKALDPTVLKFTLNWLICELNIHLY